MKSAGSSPVVTIDVAHPPLSSDEAERRLDDILRKAGLSGGTRVIRVIHGYGSGGKGGTLKTVVRNWAYSRRGKLALIIPGEEYSPFDPTIQKLLLEAGLSLSALGSSDSGTTLVFLP